MNLDRKKEVNDVAQEKFKAAQANDVQSFRWVDANALNQDYLGMIESL